MSESGYAGYLLEIDLTGRKAASIPLPESYRRQYLGGKALAAQILWDHTAGMERAFSEENPVVIAAALLTGTDAPGTLRFDVAALSPQDNLPTFANCGGAFGMLLKTAGYDALLIRGKAANPLWLEISRQGVSFHNAKDLWNLGTGGCRQKLEEKIPEQPFVSLCIGPAGEHLVKFASLVADGHSIGRAGLGAVLGWKQLKAVTVSAGRKDISERKHRTFSEEDHCLGCDLHCIRHSRKETAVLNELGLDAIAAEAAADYASQQGMAAEKLFEDIAFRVGMGARVAEGPVGQSGKSGKRRKGSHEKIARYFGLSPEEKTTGEFCRNFLEAISICGQCTLTVNGLSPDGKELPLLKFLNDVTEQDWDLEKLLSIGAYSRELEDKLKKRFQK